MYLSRYDIEMIAKRVITAYKKLPALCGQQIRMVQPELLICDLLGLSMDYHVLSQKGDILGLTACSATSVRIFDNSNSPEYYYLDGRTVLIDKRLLSDRANIGRRHFTQVHEACYQIYKVCWELCALRIYPPSRSPKQAEDGPGRRRNCTQYF